MDIQSLNFGLLKAFIDWCYDNDFKPQLVVKYFEAVGVDKSYFENDRIILNLAQHSILDLTMENNIISFKTRFNQVSHDLLIPIEHVLTCYPREHQNLFLPLYFLHKPEQSQSNNEMLDSETSMGVKQKPKLSLVSKD